MRSPRHKLMVVGGCFMAFAAISVARAETSDKKAVRAAGREYVLAARRGDAEALKRLWTEDGDYVDATGKRFKARDLISRMAPAAHSDGDAVELDLPPSSIRFITPEVAIEDGTMDLSSSNNAEKLSGRFTAVWVKRDGRWLLASLRDAVCSSPSTNERLGQLSWLLGEWIGRSNDFVILLSSDWSNDGKFIVREFLIRGNGVDDISATQRIGWDSSAGKIRCWTFDSQGGSGEGVWRRDGDRWVVESSEVLADGRRTKTSAVYTPGNGRFTSEIRTARQAGDGAEIDAELPALRVEFQRAREEE
jgi:uncharacterized protein (TIGR02246 family)